ncbi:MAG: DUF697 domain-containing protein [Acidobacteriota bacterium]
MSSRAEGAQRLVNRHALYSAAAGLVPVPLVDLAATTGIQIKMLKELSEYYGIPFQADRGKSIVGALIGGIVPTRLAYGLGGSLIKALPVVGQLLGMVTAPAFASASTYAIGKVFMSHFDSGGTLLDFDPDKMRQHFVAEYEAATKAGVTTPPPVAEVVTGRVGKAAASA